MRRLHKAMKFSRSRELSEERKLISTTLLNGASSVKASLSVKLEKIEKLDDAITGPCCRYLNVFPI